MADSSDTARSAPHTDGFLLREFVRAATRALETNQATINALNVFPVPDGDTGTNMVLTMRAIRDELEAEIDQNPSITSARMARAALLGARGNSGLILAQYFKGLAESLAGGYEVSGEGFARGMRIAADVAYRAVPDPREGTMLTVFRECADAAEAAVRERPGLQHVMSVAADAAMDAVARSPSMLDVLKDAGVVDSGGFGFAIMLRSGVDLLEGREPGVESVDPPGIVGLEQVPAGKKSGGVRVDFIESIEEEEWGYCTVFVIEGEDLDAEDIREQMAKIGRSPVVAGAANFVKVHVHMEDPGVALSMGLKLGALLNIEIQNMDTQASRWAEDRSAQPADSLTTLTAEFECSVVAVVLGEGIRELFENTGLDAVTTLAGGDSMNPSTAEILDCIESAPSKSVIVLPNNKNVIGTARQAATLSGKDVEVVETRSMQAGLAALLEFSPERELDRNIVQMRESLEIIRSGSVATAVRDALIDGVGVKQGQYMGFLDEKLVTAGDSPLEALVGMLSGQVDEESLITLYAGLGVANEVVEQAVNELARRMPGVEIETVSGGQPDQDFLVSIE